MSVPSLSPNFRTIDSRPRSLAPGKAYKIQMATISHWTKEGPMDEEYLFWDNEEFMKQIGLGK